MTTYGLDEVAGFAIVDNSEQKFAWYGREPGVVQPILAWATEPLGNGVTHATESQIR